eukprot:760910-Rhodomonas_salina.1
MLEGSIQQKKADRGQGHTRRLPYLLLALQYETCSMFVLAQLISTKCTVLTGESWPRTYASATLLPYLYWFSSTKTAVLFCSSIAD